MHNCELDVLTLLLAVPIDVLKLCWVTCYLVA